MALTHTVETKVVTAARTVLGSKTYSGDAESKLEVAIADSVTDQQVNVAIDVTAVKSILMTSDQDLTVETNDGTTPTDTINLIAGVPYLWTTDQYFTNLLTADVTALYLTNSSGATANFDMECVYDSTP